MLPFSPFNQELVNLLLCGRAVSNVFDNDMELDSGNANMTLLKGIKGHCEIGLLSLFEHYNICKVSDFVDSLETAAKTNHGALISVICAFSYTKYRVYRTPSVMFYFFFR